ncbi:hypothetical protein NDN08_004899 [Rhodosorus marinus]|uniref:Uncharacterized protein n=1 Tax=Rhodosorus marinus TaxID=101924 RepID=A0AAV8UIA2_9RHOD|nr:hypothetical protein NDN08_004899 [Rhodosorus marinus]
MISLRVTLMVLCAAVVAVSGVPVRHLKLDSIKSSRSSTCTPTGIFPSAADGYLGCATLSDFVDLLTNAMDSVLEGAGDLSPVIETVADGAVSALVDALSAYEKTSGVMDSAVCLGDFEASAILEPEDDGIDASGCSMIPVADSGEWSVLAFSIPAITAICPTVESGEYLTMCLAFTTCSDLPSFALTVNSNLINCLFANTAALEGSGGLSSVVGESVELALDAIAVGVSLTNSFQTTGTVMTANGAEEIALAGTYFDAVDVDISSEKFSLPDCVSLSGSFQRTVYTTADASEFNDLINAASVEEAGADILDALSSIDISILMTGELDWNLELSSLTLGALPDFEDMELAEFTAYLTTATASLSTGTTVYPGVYLYTQESNAILDTVVTFATSILEAIDGAADALGWLSGWEVSSAVELLDGLDSSSSGVSMGFLVNTEEIRVSFGLELGGGISLAVTAAFDLENDQFGFSINIGGIAQFFTAVANFVDSQLTWIVSHAEDFFDTTGDIVGTAIASAANDTSAFCKDAINTSEGAIDAAADAIADLTSGIEDNVEDMADYVYDAAEDAEEAVADGAEDAYNAAVDYTNDVADFVDNVVSGWF